MFQKKIMSHKKSCLVKKKKKKDKKKAMSKKKGLISYYPCAFAQGHFRPLNNFIFSFQFSLYFGEKNFEEKTLEPHNLFFFLSTQLNIFQKSFPFHFVSKVFYLLYFTSKQHTFR